MRTVEIQIAVGAEWWVLNRVRCNDHELPKAHADLTKMLADWQNSRCFEGGTHLRVHET